MTFAQLHAAIIATWPGTHYESSGLLHTFTIPGPTSIEVWQGATGPRIMVSLGPARDTIPDAIGAAQDEARELRDDEASARLSAVWEQWMAKNAGDDSRIARVEVER